MNWGAGRRHGSDPELLWLWLWPAATAPIGPLAWEPPYAEGAALKRQKKRRRRSILQEIFFFFCLFVVVAISWAAPTAYGGSQARG